MSYINFNSFVQIFSLMAQPVHRDFKIIPYIHILKAVIFYIHIEQQPQFHRDLSISVISRVPLRDYLFL